MSRKLFVNIAVEDLDRSVEFFTKLGFEFNPQFTDETATCMLVGEDAYFMLITRERFGEFRKKPLSDAARRPRRSTRSTADSREAVDELVEHRDRERRRRPRRAAGPGLHVQPRLRRSGRPPLRGLRDGSGGARQGSPEDERGGHGTSVRAIPRSSRAGRGAPPPGSTVGDDRAVLALQRRDGVAARDVAVPALPVQARLLRGRAPIGLRTDGRAQARRYVRRTARVGSRAVCADRERTAAPPFAPCGLATSAPSPRCSDGCAATTSTPHAGCATTSRRSRLAPRAPAGSLTGTGSSATRWSCGTGGGRRTTRTPGSGCSPRPASTAPEPCSGAASCAISTRSASTRSSRTSSKTRRARPSCAHTAFDSTAPIASRCSTPAWSTSASCPSASGAWQRRATASSPSPPSADLHALYELSLATGDDMPGIDDTAPRLVRGVGAEPAPVPRPRRGSERGRRQGRGARLALAAERRPRHPPGAQRGDGGPRATIAGSASPRSRSSRRSAGRPSTESRRSSPTTRSRTSPCSRSTTAWATGR